MLDDLVSPMGQQDAAEMPEIPANDGAAGQADTIDIKPGSQGPPSCGQVRTLPARGLIPFAEHAFFGSMHMSMGLLRCISPIILHRIESLAALYHKAES